ESIIDIPSGIRDVQEAALPKDRPAHGAGIEGVEGVVLSGDEDNVMNPRRAGLGVDTTGDGDSGVHQWLGVNLAIHRRDEQFIERADLYIAWDELGFVGVQAGAGNVVVKGQDVHGRRQSRFKLFQSQLVAAQRSTRGRSSREFEWLPFHSEVSLVNEE